MTSVYSSPCVGLGKRSFFMPKIKFARLENWKVSKNLYTEDKPTECSQCYFWAGRKKCCTLGKENCYYRRVEEKANTNSQCDGCPYGRDHPCIGWCTRKILRKDAGKVGEASVV